jgi:hypothetical protein
MCHEIVVLNSVASPSNFWPLQFCTADGYGVIITSFSTNTMIQGIVVAHEIGHKYVLCSISFTNSLSPSFVLTNALVF